ISNGHPQCLHTWVSKETPTRQRIAHNVTQLFPDVLTEDTHGLPPWRKVNFEIELLPGASPPAQRPYRMSLRDQQELKTQLQQLKTQGLIQESSSPYAAPCLFVDKKDGGQRLCIDYRRLNAATIPNKTSPPRIEDCIDSVGQSTFLSVIDLRSGYWQLRIRETDIPKTAFVTPFGLYEWLVMPFGMMNAPATFIRLLNSIFFDLLGKSVSIFFDDIIVYSSTAEDHEQHLTTVFDRLRKHKLYTKAFEMHLCVKRDQISWTHHR
ncbi:MAG: reverse transcriptase family protein, partial [Cyanobacteria bacterium J06553_1]